MRRAKAVKLFELLVITAVVLIVRAVSVYADALGTIEGQINNNTGAALSGAHVAVTCKSTNKMATTLTAEGVPTARGGQWAAATVRRVILSEPAKTLG